MFWTFIALLSLAAVAAVVYPLLRRGVYAGDQKPSGVGVYREQLADLDRDLAYGLLTEGEFDAARLEVERRIVAVARTAKAPALGIGVLGRRLTVAAIIFVLPAGAVPLYLYLGMPGQPDRPLAQRGDELKQQKQLRLFASYAKTLATRLEKTPDDAEAWTTLGRLYRMLRRFPESADAYGRAHALKPNGASAAADHGEALIHVSGGNISGASEKMFRAAVAANPKHLKARFYLGSALAQRPKELPEAIEIWRGLEKDSPQDAPWLDMLRQNLRLAEAELANLTDARPAIETDAGKRAAKNDRTAR